MARGREQHIEHLLRRAAFGAVEDDVTSFAAMPFVSAVERLLSFERSPDDVDGKIGTPGYVGVTARAATGFQPLTNIDHARQRWLFRMVHSERPLQEKMALFWHNHFATAYTKIAGHLRSRGRDPPAVGDLVQVLSDRLSSIAGLDEDLDHWVSVAVRESVINAIKHGNREDHTKHVVVEFILRPRSRPEEFVVRVLDEGEGFDPSQIANPLDPENVLKSSGRGIFFMRNFMDDVSITRRPEGGMDVRMSKKLA